MKSEMKPIFTLILIAMAIFSADAQIPQSSKVVCRVIKEADMGPDGSEGVKECSFGSLFLITSEIWDPRGRLLGVETLISIKKGGSSTESSLLNLLKTDRKDELWTQIQIGAKADLAKKKKEIDCYGNLKMQELHIDKLEISLSEEGAFFIIAYAESDGWPCEEVVRYYHLVPLNQLSEYLNI